MEEGNIAIEQKMTEEGKSKEEMVQDEEKNRKFRQRREEDVKITLL